MAVLHWMPDGAYHLHLRIPQRAGNNLSFHLEYAGNIRWREHIPHHSGRHHSALLQHHQLVAIARRQIQIVLQRTILP